MTACARFAWIAVALALAAQPVAMHGSELTDDLTKLFDLGIKGTPSAVAAAQAQYAQLTRANSQDQRLDYAFAVVLVNQHQYRDALPLLAQYLKTDKPELTAFYLKMWAEIPLGNFADVLDQATALGQHFPSGSSSSEPEEMYRDAARHLGTIFGYLELVRPSAVDSDLRSQRKNEVLDRLGKTYTPAFDEGHGAVAKRLSQLQAQQKAELEKLKSKTEDRKGQAQSKADATHNTAAAGGDAAKSSEKKLDDAKKESQRIQAQLSPLQTSLSNVQAQIAKTQMIISGPQNPRNVVRKQTLQANLVKLNSQADALMRQIAPLQKRADELKSKEERQAKALAKDAAAARKAEKLAEAADKRVHDADAQLNSGSGALDSKMARISNYAPFPYETERKRVLSWFSK